MAVYQTGDATFQNDVLNNAKTVLVDFYADWCGPCKMLSPIVDELSEEVPEVDFYKLNVDQAMETAIRYGVSSIPTLMVFKGGEAAARSVGYCSKEEIEEMLK